MKSLGDNVIRRTWRPLGRSVALASSLVLLVLGVAAPARAETPEEHCVILLGDDDAAAAEAVVCADTREAALEAFTAETGYTVVETGSGAAESGSAAAESSENLGPLVVYSLAELFADAGYGGTSHLITRSTPCDGVTLSGVSNLGTVGLNDAVSSFQTYSTCTVRLYANASYGGSTYGWATSQSSLPTFNDTASSARVR